MVCMPPSQACRCSSSGTLDEALGFPERHAQSCEFMGALTARRRVWVISFRIISTASIFLNLA